MGIDDPTRETEEKTGDKSFDFHPELAQLVEDYKEHSRLALHHQQEAYFRMVGILEALTTGDGKELERIIRVIKTLKIL